MAKIKKRKLVWKASDSPQVVGYKLYWSEQGNVDYQSACARLGNVNEVVLPDDVDGFENVKGPVELGITAVDELGNESDLVILKTPYQFNVPKAPSDLWIETLQQYHTTAEKSERLPENSQSESSAAQNSQEPSIRLIGNKPAPVSQESRPVVQQAPGNSSSTTGNVQGAGASQSNRE